MEHSGHNLSRVAAKARLLALEMVHTAASGHIGGSLSSIELLTALYFGEMKVNPDAPRDPARDRFVMSKGHCTPGLYAMLSLRGFFPESELAGFRHVSAHLSGHAEMQHVKGVDMSTGSLGQGLSAAVGMAIAAKLDHADYRVYAMVGDGELAEGQIWEACMAAAKYDLDNLCVLVDVNGLQIDGATKDVMPTEPIDKKFEAFGFAVQKVDGHNIEEIQAALAKARQTKGKPSVILASTVKGKGVSFMENDYNWHGKAPNDEQFAVAKQELEAVLAGLEGR